MRQMSSGIGIARCGNGGISYMVPLLSLPPSSFSVQASLSFNRFLRGKGLAWNYLAPYNDNNNNNNTGYRQRRGYGIVASSDVASPSVWDDWKPLKGSSTPSLSDILWPSAGAFAAMAILGKMDQLLAPKGVSMTIAPLGAVSAVLFATPSTPAARKYNVFMAQIGCAAIGVLAFTIFGAGWLARSAGLSACIAYMIYTGSIHPPAASLPLLFIDGVKLHRLNFWYALFPGAAGCILLSLIQEVVVYLKQNFKF